MSSLSYVCWSLFFSVLLIVLLLIRFWHRVKRLLWKRCRLSIVLPRLTWLGFRDGWILYAPEALSLSQWSISLEDSEREDALVQETAMLSSTSFKDLKNRYRTWIENKLRLDGIKWENQAVPSHERYVHLSWDEREKLRSGGWLIGFEDLNFSIFISPRSSLSHSSSSSQNNRDQADQNMDNNQASFFGHWANEGYRILREGYALKLGVFLEGIAFLTFYQVIFLPTPTSSNQSERFPSRVNTDASFGETRSALFPVLSVLKGWKDSMGRYLSRPSLYFRNGSSKLRQYFGVVVIFYRRFMSFFIQQIRIAGQWLGRLLLHVLWFEMRLKRIDVGIHFGAYLLRDQRASCTEKAETKKDSSKAWTAIHANILIDHMSLSMKRWPFKLSMNERNGAPQSLYESSLVLGPTVLDLTLLPISPSPVMRLLSIPNPSFLSYYWMIQTFYVPHAKYLRSDMLRAMESFVSNSEDLLPSGRSSKWSSREKRYWKRILFPLPIYLAIQNGGLEMNVHEEWLQQLMGTLSISDPIHGMSPSQQELDDEYFRRPSLDQVLMREKSSQDVVSHSWLITLLSLYQSFKSANKKSEVFPTRPSSSLASSSPYWHKLRSALTRARFRPRWSRSSENYDVSGTQNGHELNMKKDEQRDDVREKASLLGRELSYYTRQLWQMMSIWLKGLDLEVTGPCILNFVPHSESSTLMPKGSNPFWRIGVEKVEGHLGFGKLEYAPSSSGNVVLEAVTMSSSNGICHHNRDPKKGQESAVETTDVRGLKGTFDIHDMFVVHISAERDIKVGGAKSHYSNSWMASDNETESESDSEVDNDPLTRPMNKSKSTKSSVRMKKSYIAGLDRVHCCMSASFVRLRDNLEKDFDLWPMILMKVALKRPFLVLDLNYLEESDYITAISPSMLKSFMSLYHGSFSGIRKKSLLENADLYSGVFSSGQRQAEQILQIMEELTSLPVIFHAAIEMESFSVDLGSRKICLPDSLQTETLLHLISEKHLPEQELTGQISHKMDEPGKFDQLRAMFAGSSRSSSCARISLSSILRPQGQSATVHEEPAQAQRTEGATIVIQGKVNPVVVYYHHESLSNLMNSWTGKPLLLSSSSHGHHMQYEDRKVDSLEFVLNEALLAAYWQGCEGSITSMLQVKRDTSDLLSLTEKSAASPEVVNETKNNPMTRANDDRILPSDDIRKGTGYSKRISDPGDSRLSKYFLNSRAVSSFRSLMGSLQKKYSTRFTSTSLVDPHKGPVNSVAMSSFKRKLCLQMTSSGLTLHGGLIIPWVESNGIVLLSQFKQCFVHYADQIGKFRTNKPFGGSGENWIKCLRIELRYMSCQSQTTSFPISIGPFVMLVSHPLLLASCAPFHNFLRASAMMDTGSARETTKRDLSSVSSHKVPHIFEGLERVETTSLCMVGYGGVFVRNGQRLMESILRFFLEGRFLTKSKMDNFSSRLDTPAGQNQALGTIYEAEGWTCTVNKRRAQDLLQYRMCNLAWMKSLFKDEMNAFRSLRGIMKAASVDSNLDKTSCKPVNRSSTWLKLSEGQIWSLGINNENMIHIRWPQEDDSNASLSLNMEPFGYLNCIDMMVRIPCQIALIASFGLAGLKDVMESEALSFGLGYLSRQRESVSSDPELTRSRSKRNETLFQFPQLFLGRIQSLLDQARIQDDCLPGPNKVWTPEPEISIQHGESKLFVARLLSLYIPRVDINIMLPEVDLLKRGDLSYAQVDMISIQLNHVSSFVGSSYYSSDDPMTKVAYAMSVGEGGLDITLGKKASSCGKKFWERLSDLEDEFREGFVVLSKLNNDPATELVNAELNSEDDLFKDTMARKLRLEIGLARLDCMCSFDQYRSQPAESTSPSADLDNDVIVESVENGCSVVEQSASLFEQLIERRRLEEELDMMESLFLNRFSDSNYVEEGRSCNLGDDSTWQTKFRLLHGQDLEFGNVMVVEPEGTNPKGETQIKHMGLKAETWRERMIEWQTSVDLLLAGKRAPWDISQAQYRKRYSSHYGAYQKQSSGHHGQDTNDVTEDNNNASWNICSPLTYGLIDWTSGCLNSPVTPRRSCPWHELWRSSCHSYSLESFSCYPFFSSSIVSCSRSLNRVSAIWALSLSLSDLSVYIPYQFPLYQVTDGLVMALYKLMIKPSKRVLKESTRPFFSSEQYESWVRRIVWNYVCENKGSNWLKDKEPLNARDWQVIPEFAGLDGVDELYLLPPIRAFAETVKIVWLDDYSSSQSEPEGSPSASSSYSASWLPSSVKDLNIIDMSRQFNPSALFAPSYIEGKLDRLFWLNAKMQKERLARLSSFWKQVEAFALTQEDWMVEISLDDEVKLKQIESLIGLPHLKIREIRRQQALLHAAKLVSAEIPERQDDMSQSHSYKGQQTHKPRSKMRTASVLVSDVLKVGLANVSKPFKDMSFDHHIFSEDTSNLKDRTSNKESSPVSKTFRSEGLLTQWLVGSSVPEERLKGFAAGSQTDNVSSKLDLNKPESLRSSQVFRNKFELSNSKTSRSAPATRSPSPSASQEHLASFLPSPLMENDLSFLPSSQTEKVPLQLEKAGNYDRPSTYMLGDSHDQWNKSVNRRLAYCRRHDGIEPILTAADYPELLMADVSAKVITADENVEGFSSIGTNSGAAAIAAVRSKLKQKKRIKAVSSWAQERILVGMDDSIDANNNDDRKDDSSSRPKPSSNACDDIPKDTSIRVNALRLAYVQLLQQEATIWRLDVQKYFQAGSLRGEMNLFGLYGESLTLGLLPPPGLIECIQASSGLQWVPSESIMRYLERFMFSSRPHVFASPHQSSSKLDEGIEIMESLEMCRCAWLEGKLGTLNIRLRDDIVPLVKGQEVTLEGLLCLTEEHRTRLSIEPLQVRPCIYPGLSSGNHFEVGPNKEETMIRMWYSTHPIHVLESLSLTVKDASIAWVHVHWLPLMLSWVESAIDRLSKPLVPYANPYQAVRSVLQSLYAKISRALKESVPGKGSEEMLLDISGWMKPLAWWDKLRLVIKGQDTSVFAQRDFWVAISCQDRLFQMDRQSPLLYHKESKNNSLLSCPETLYFGTAYGAVLTQRCQDVAEHQHDRVSAWHLQTDLNMTLTTNTLSSLGRSLNAEGNPFKLWDEGLILRPPYPLFAANGIHETRDERSAVSSGSSVSSESLPSIKSFGSLPLPSIHSMSGFSRTNSFSFSSSFAEFCNFHREQLPDDNTDQSAVRQVHPLLSTSLESQIVIACWPGLSVTLAMVWALENDADQEICIQDDLDDVMNDLVTEDDPLEMAAHMSKQSEAKIIDWIVRWHPNIARRIAHIQGKWYRIAQSRFPDLVSHVLEDRKAHGTKLNLSDSSSVIIVSPFMAGWLGLQSYDCYRDYRSTGLTIELTCKTGTWRKANCVELPATEKSPSMGGPQIQGERKDHQEQQYNVTDSHHEEEERPFVMFSYYRELDEWIDRFLIPNFLGVLSSLRDPRNGWIFGSGMEVELYRRANFLSSSTSSVDRSMTTIHPGGREKSPYKSGSQVQKRIWLRRDLQPKHIINELKFQWETGPIVQRYIHFLEDRLLQALSGIRAMRRKPQFPSDADHVDSSLNEGKESQSGDTKTSGSYNLGAAERNLEQGGFIGLMLLVDSMNGVLLLQHQRPFDPRRLVTITEKHDPLGQMLGYPNWARRRNISLVQGPIILRHSGLPSWTKEHVKNTDDDETMSISRKREKLAYRIRPVEYTPNYFEVDGGATQLHLLSPLQHDTLDESVLAKRPSDLKLNKESLRKDAVSGTEVDKNEPKKWDNSARNEEDQEGPLGELWQLMDTWSRFCIPGVKQWPAARLSKFVIFRVGKVVSELEFKSGKAGYNALNDDMVRPTEEEDRIKIQLLDENVQRLKLKKWIENRITELERKADSVYSMMQAAVTSNKLERLKEEYAMLSERLQFLLSHVGRYSASMEQRSYSHSSKAQSSMFVVMHRFHLKWNVRLRNAVFRLMDDETQWRLFSRIQHRGAFYKTWVRDILRSLKEGEWMKAERGVKRFVTFEKALAEKPGDSPALRKDEDRNEMSSQLKRKMSFDERMAMAMLKQLVADQEHEGQDLKEMRTSQASSSKEPSPSPFEDSERIMDQNTQDRIDSPSFSGDDSEDNIDLGSNAVIHDDDGQADAIRYNDPSLAIGADLLKRLTRATQLTIHFLAPQIAFEGPSSTAWLDQLKGLVNMMDGKQGKENDPNIGHGTKTPGTVILTAQRASLERAQWTRRHLEPSDVVVEKRNFGVEHEHAEKDEDVQDEEFITVPDGTKNRPVDWSRRMELNWPRELAGSPVQKMALSGRLADDISSLSLLEETEGNDTQVDGKTSSTKPVKATSAADEIEEDPRTVILRSRTSFLFEGAEFYVSYKSHWRLSLVLSHLYYPWNVLWLLFPSLFRGLMVHILHLPHLKRRRLYAQR